MWTSEWQDNLGRPFECATRGSVNSGVVPSRPPVIVPVNEFTRPPTIQGNHVTALPYWNVAREVSSDISDIVLEREWYAPGTSSWPPVCTNSLQQSGRQTYRASAAGYVARVPTDLGTPKISEDTWLFAQQMADTKALASLNRALVNIPMLLKERKETIVMMSSRVAGIANAAKRLQQDGIAALRKAKSRTDRRRVTRDVANIHLETVFGWLPLMAEIEGSIEYASRPVLDFIRANGTHTVEVGRRSTDHRSTVPLPHTGFASVTNNLGWVIGQGQILDLASVRTALRFKLDFGYADDLRLLGADPISTFYDMVPLSFVSGWVSNFDAYVRTLTPLIGLTFETGSRNRRTRSKYGAGYHFEPDVVGNYRYRISVRSNAYQLGNVVARVDRNTRSVLTQPPEASLHFGLDAGAFEIAATASLLVQRYLKPLRAVVKSRPFRYRGPMPKNLPPIKYRSI